MITITSDQHIPLSIEFGSGIATDASYLLYKSSIDGHLINKNETRSYIEIVSDQSTLQVVRIVLIDIYIGDRSFSPLFDYESLKDFGSDQKMGHIPATPTDVRISEFYCYFSYYVSIESSVIELKIGNKRADLRYSVSKNLDIILSEHNEIIGIIIHDNDIIKEIDKNIRLIEMETTPVIYYDE